MLDLEILGRKTWDRLGETLQNLILLLFAHDMCGMKFEHEWIMDLQIGVPKVDNPTLSVRLQ